MPKLPSKSPETALWSSQSPHNLDTLFNVKVLKVNTINVSGKEKRVGRNIGKTADWKKAIVSIDVNPGAEQSYLTKGGKVTKVTKKYNDSIAEVTGV